MRLGHWPTPLDELFRFSQHLGGPRLFAKREDLTPLALGGNKIRKLEYALAEAQAHRATTLVTSGATQSNHVRLTIAAGNRLGLNTVAVLRGQRPSSPTGKAMAGLVNLVRKGAFCPQDAVVFLHTGGVPALFADAQAPTFQVLAGPG